MAETALKRSILKWLAQHAILAWSNPRNAFTRSGLPDISGVLPGGRAFFIEAKHPDDYADDADAGLRYVQERWIRWLRASGALVIVASSLAEVQKALAKFARD